ncbi:DNA adenine methylase [Candidatus Bathyarchaeota archaeon]|nr:DNA adenine methylase [Candidatus Bathyarchaeota archaeon]
MHRIPRHRVYVEPFVGAGHVFWAKEPAEVEVINDLDPGLMKWYQDLKKRSRFSCDMTPNKEKFYRIREKPGPLSFCDYLHLIKFSYGCKRRDYSPSKLNRCLESEDPSTCTVNKLANNFDRFRDRLSRTRILKRDYRDVLKKYDGPDTFFYLDPPFHELSCPYVSCEVSPRQIADAVRKLKGKWLLSYNDHPDVRAAFKGYKIEKFENQYSMNESDVKQVFEVLIRNY